MFRKAKNIDTAFKMVRLYSLIIIAVFAAITLYTIYKSFSAEEKRREQVLILPSGKLIEAVSSNRKDNLSVEARDHIKTYHHYFFTLSPDDDFIQQQISKALYLADQTAKQQYDNLRESNYYTNIVSGNISQSLTVDSIRLDLKVMPYRFRYYGYLKIVRPTSVVTRSLVTEGILREVPRSLNNPHGFLIERWKILQNKDLSVKKR